VGAAGFSDILIVQKLLLEVDYTLPDKRISIINLAQNSPLEMGNRGRKVDICDQSRKYHTITSLIEWFSGASLSASK